MKRFFTYITITVFTITTVAAPFIQPVSAAPTEAQCDDEAFRAALEKNYRLQNMDWYDPCSEDVCSTGSSLTPGSSSTFEKTETITAIWNYLTTTALSTNENKPLTPVQVAGIMGNFDAESSFNPSAIEDTTRTEKGHGLAQWTFGRWDNLSNFAQAQNKPWDDLTVQLEFLKNELEGPERGVLTDPQFKAASDPKVAAMRWRIVFERADPAQAHDDRRKNSAVALYNLFGGAAVNCSNSGSIVAGDFVKTAINFALTSPASDTMNEKTDARDTYQQAKEEFNPTVQWTDCGGYIATSLYASGVDKNYPNVSVAAQKAYVVSATDKYTTIDKPTLGDLQPGDILFIDGHVTLYTGEEEFPMVDASLGQRVPSVRTDASLQWMLSQSDIMAARLLK